MLIDHNGCVWRCCRDVVLSPEWERAWLKMSLANSPSYSLANLQSQLEKLSVRIRPETLQRRVEKCHGRELRIGDDEVLENVFGVTDPFNGPKVFYVEYSARGRHGRTRVPTTDRLTETLIIGAPAFKSGREAACTFVCVWGEDGGEPDQR